jgi:hypothetical protein
MTTLSRSLFNDCTEPLGESEHREAASEFRRDLSPVFMMASWSELMLLLMLLTAWV